VLRGSFADGYVDTLFHLLLVLLKIISELLSLAMCLFGMTECLVKKHPVPTKQATVSLFKVKSCSVLLRVLLCIYVAI